LDPNHQESVVNKSAITVLFSTILMAGALTCQAQEIAAGQVTSGMSRCSFANSMGIEVCEETPSYYWMELERQRRELAQEQAVRELCNSLLHRSANSPTPAVPNDCAGRALVR
jgi:hypothetical protein